jgi:serine/threonine protein kinase
MELVEGKALETRVRRDGPLNPKLVVEIAIQAAQALVAAAAQGLIHRDLKPGNIMLAPDDAGANELEVKIIDFGLAKALASAGGEMHYIGGSGRKSLTRKSMVLRSYIMLKQLGSPTVRSPRISTSL